MHITAPLDKLLVAIVAVPTTALLVVVLVVPLAIRATAERVHAGADAVPSRTTPPAEPRWAAAAEAAGRLARTRVADDNLPGLSVAVGAAGRLVWSGGFGWADIEARQPITPDSRFRIGGVSMPLTAAGVGVLVARGKLDLDAPVQRYVPGFPAKPFPVTTRQSMAHTAGFGHHRYEGDRIHRRRCDHLGQALDLFAGDSLKFEPGTDWSYSTYGWIVASAVVESAAGAPFADHMAREVFAPLGMQATVPDDADRPAPQQAAFYFPRGQADTQYGLEHPDPVDYSCFAGGGRYLSTPSDLVRFGLAMDRHALLDPATTALLETPVVLPSGRSTDYGLGWSVREVPFAGGRTTLLSHPGKAVGGTSVLQRYPAHGIVVAVSSNVSFATLAPYAAQVAALFASAAAAREEFSGGKGGDGAPAETPAGR